MNLKRLTALGASTMALTCALGMSPAFAGEADDANRFVAACDSNKDGMLSKEEVMKRVEHAWNMADTGKKGMIDKKQAAVFMKELFRDSGR